MNKRLIFPAIIAVMILSGCSGAPQQASLSKADKDRIYIKTVRDEYPKLSARDSLLVEVAEAACGAFDVGASQSDVIATIYSHAGKAQLEMAYAVGVAVSIYCPEHHSKLKSG